MTDKIFDDFLREKLRNHSSPVPSGLWERIEKEKKRRPAGFFWNSRLLVIGSLLLLVSSIGGLMWRESTKNNLQETSAATAGTTSTNQPSSEQIGNEKGNALNESANEIAEKKSPTGNEKDQSIVNNTTASKEPINDAGGPVVIVRNKKTSTKKTANNATGAHKESTNNNNTLFIASTNKKAYKQNKLYPSSSNDLGKASLTTANNNLQQTIQQENISLGNIASKPFGKGQLMFIDRNAMAISNKFSFANMQNLKSIVDCPSTNGHPRNDWYVEVYGSPDYTIKSVKGNAASNDFLQKKDSTESMKVGYTIGGRFVKNLSEHLVLKAGLQFSQVNERFTLRTENERITTIIITQKTVTDAFGNTTIVNDTSTVTQIGYLVRTSNNSYRNIQVPVILGYEFGNDKWKFGINGGAIFNVASWYKGKTLDTSFQSIAISSKSSGDVYKSSVGLSLYGSISIIKPVTERLSIFAEPYFRYSLSDLSSSLGYKQRFNTMGLSFGIRYKLSNLVGQQ